MMCLVNDQGEAMNIVPDLLVVPELAANPEQWFLLCTKRPVKP